MSLIPQRIFTGYVFPTADSIKPFLEEPITGPTSRFSSELATRLRCHVVAGYPERLPDEEIEPGVDEWGNDITRVGANSAILFGPDGGCVGKYRKTNLFETDTTWAKSGESPYLRVRRHPADNLDW
jgi:protein N-terminal amidase